MIHELDRNLVDTKTNAYRMMAFAEAESKGVFVRFADGKRGLIPYRDIGGIKGQQQLLSVHLSNRFLLLLKLKDNQTIEIPWDFARHYCDGEFKNREMILRTEGRQILGRRVNMARTMAGLTQSQLALRAGIGRVTLSSIENGRRSPRYDTLMSIAQGLKLPLESLLVSKRED